MYWTHLIFALLHGLLITWDEIAASKPGYLDFDNLPETNFSCDGKVIGGYYADVETGCQMFHVCTIGQKGEVTDIKFLCLNGTVFDQETRVCERIDEVDCAKSEDFFSLNLELYGNNANFGGIQPENEFEAECDDCSTDEEYEETTIQQTTTPTPSTTTTTTTTPRPTTTQRTYQSGDSIQALLALHSAFSKPPPPRLINNAFSPKPTHPTRRPSQPPLTYKPRYTPDSQSYGSLNLQQRERPYYFTPATEKSNYHHFHSGDTSFGHSFDATRPYNFQYFHSRKLPEDDKASVSVVTSTSTSTSVKTSKGNSTDYPTAYEDYQDDIQDHAFFQDVPKLRQKRETNPTHRFDDEETTTPRHKNHKYDDELSKETSDERGEFLQNLLGSIDLDERVREKMTDFFKQEDEEMEKLEKDGNSVSDFGNKIGQVFTQEMNLSRTDDKKSKGDKLSEWTKHFEEMKKDINLNYTFESNFTTDGNREKRDTLKTGNTRSTIAPSYTQERSQPRRINIDTEQFRVEPRRRKTGGQSEFKPVSESIEDDFTTVEYRRSSKTGRSQPKSTTSLRAFTFNYESTTALPASQEKLSRVPKSNQPTSKEIVDFVHEENEYNIPRRENIPERKQPQPVPAYDGGSSEEFASREVVSPPSVGRQRSRVVVAKRTRVMEQGTREAQEETPKVGRARQRTRVPIEPQQARVEVRSRSRQQPTAPAISAQPTEEPVVRHQPQRTRARGRPPQTPPDTSAEASAVRQKPRQNTRHQADDGSSGEQEAPQVPPLRVPLTPDPAFDCEGKVKGGFYADTYNNCKAFFICSQGAIGGPLLKSHFACGDKTKFNQRSRTCQAEDLVECQISNRYYHLNNDFLAPVSEDELRGGFEPMKQR